MVVGAFPAAKLGALLLKQISKPIANALKTQAKSSPVFRKYVCMPPAQFYNWCEVKTKMWILNLGKPVNIPVLNEAMAIELGANLLGEGIIFLIAAGLLIMEYNRSSNKEAAKEEAKKQEMQDLQNTIRELFIQTEEQGAQLRELTRQLGNLDTKLTSQKLQNIDSKKPISGPSGTGAPLILNSTSYKEQFSTKNSYHKNKSFTQPSYNLEKTPFNKEQSRSIILKAVNDVEDQFWNYPLVHEEEESFLFLSLYHIQKLLRLQP
ncbi:optic atrophy 3 protein homolog [Diabrotica undecimpunctata]|uniref:optic atrophy 3 protein homolog n=1 Tax=Diabrotica undecimpunctata TaxID=50387 RepID=UPI003B63DB13